MNIALKIDVETRRGLVNCVPALLSVLKRCGVKASFFVPMGPDRTGMTVIRGFKNPLILEKAFRTSVFEIYGFPTLFYGTILPAPNVVSGNEAMLLRIPQDGHELGIHAYDHFRWQDFLFKMDERSIGDELDKATDKFKSVVGAPPTSFASPGWQINEKASRALDGRNFLYTSNTRGTGVYFPRFGSYDSNTIEVPTTLPPLDELHIPRSEPQIAGTIDYYLERLNGEGLNVYTMHAEIEGAMALAFFEKFIDVLKRRGTSFKTLREIAEHHLKEKNSIKRSSVVKGTVRGRSTPIALQSL